MKKNNLKAVFVLCMIIFLPSCVTTPQIYNMRISISTVDINNNPLDAVCTIYSSSNKKDVLAPLKTSFFSECSSLNVICKSGNLRGQNGHIEDSRSPGSDAVINTGIGYIFNRAVDSITPMGPILNFFDTNDECSDLSYEIKVVLE